MYSIHINANYNQSGMATRAKVKGYIKHGSKISKLESKLCNEGETELRLTFKQGLNLSQLDASFFCYFTMDNS